ncbi:membrane protein [Candidatus Thiomargarita nelsonii]|uniref:Membrane protein n=1 Tax=Candidatus Thiomargarita nelsonii TaxID=1003181 RepID=A0A4E0QNZ1_9GAMM|nr:membrane protein [Candidatus Thiomargarita nelsonii]
MNTYLTLKSLHLLGVIIFIGNIIVTGWWKVMADRTKNPLIIAFAQRQVTLTDYIFTTGGVILILVTGIGNAVLHDMDYLNIVWLAWGFWLFILSGVIWALILIPIQIKQAKMSQQFSKDGLIPDNYWHLGRLWLFFGILATLLPLLNIYWMVFKNN